MSSIAFFIESAENQAVLKTSEGLAAKLQSALQTTGLKPVEVARACRVTPQAVNGWIKTGRVDKRHLPKLAELFGRPVDWWLENTSIIDNAAPIASHGRRVPLISWVRAGHWCDIEDPYNPGDADQWVTPIGSHGVHTFALRIEGDSMMAPSGLSFPEGCTIIVDPERAPMAGDFVVAKDVATQKATFKRLTTDGSRWFLKPLNPSYPAIEIDDPGLRVIGVAVEWQMGGRL